MPSNSQLEVSVSMSQAILATARSLGLENTDSLLQSAGIDKQQLAKPENRIPFERQQALWIRAIERTNNPSFALHFARTIQPTSFGLLGYMLMNCRTINDCLDSIVKYQFLSGQGGDFSVEKSAAGTSVYYTAVNPDHPITRHRVEAMLATQLSFGRWLVGASFRPKLVEFYHSAPADIAEYEEFFDAPVYFERRDNRVVYDACVTKLPVPNASDDLLQLLSERANRLMIAMEDQPGIASRVARLLATQLNNSVPGRSVISSQLGMSERTLQRRLSDEGTNYQAVLDKTRHHMACELLKNTQLTLGEVAQQLGFSEPSAFFRAFKKWQGVTPGQFRSEVLS